MLLFARADSPRVYIMIKVKLLSRVRIFVTPWTVADQASPSMGFPGKSTGVGCHFLLQGDVPDPGIDPGFLAL